MSIKLLHGDCRVSLAGLEAGSVHTCVTSPPYWGLRDYGLEPLIWGGVDGCEHTFGNKIAGSSRGGSGTPNGRNGHGEDYARASARGQFCVCGAWQGSLGLEPTPELYVQHMVEIMRAVRRVLRKDGTLWLNIGDSYSGSHGNGWKQSINKVNRTDGGSSNFDLGRDIGRNDGPGVKPKDLIGIPWMLAFALRTDGWYLRSDIIWAKPNGMPESVTDRPTHSHEYLFLLSQSYSYYYDHKAIREPGAEPGRQRFERIGGANGHTVRHSEGGMIGASETRNKRSVWEVTTSPYPEAHFATFPPKLITPCIKAGAPPGGTVLDPFAGSGTTGLVADRLGREAILCELSDSYTPMSADRLFDDAPMFVQVEVEKMVQGELLL